MLPKNILFDLGNVIIDIDFSLTIDAFRNMGVSDFYVDLDQTDPVFYNLEVGKIGVEEFIEYWKKQCGTNDVSGIIDAWNALLIGIKDDVFPLLKQLKEHYNLFVFSNTNAIHMDWIMKYLNQDFGIQDWVPEIFHAVYYSHVLGHRKPEADGFLAILNEQHILAEETLFIDDHLPNILGAMNLGFQTIHKQKNVSLSEVIKRNKLLFK